MARTVVIDELHITLRIPDDLPDNEAEAIRETLEGDDFMSRIRRAIREVVRMFPELSVVRVSLSK